MRLNATTAAATTTATTRIKTITTTTITTNKQTLQATTTTTTNRTKLTTLHKIEYFICNLIQLFILTTTIICTASAIDTGLVTEAGDRSGIGAGGDLQSNNNNNNKMAAFSGQFDDYASAAKAATFQFSTDVPHTHPHHHAHQHTHMQQLAAATTTTTATLRVSYDSNEIDNSYAVAGAAAAEVNVNVDVDVDVDSDADADADDVETVADDYVIALGQGLNTTNEKNDRPATTLATTTTITVATLVNGEHLINAKAPQDLLSLSQLSSHQTSTATHEKNASSLKNSVGNFQQIGSQRVNGNVSPTSPASPAHNLSSNNSQQVSANGSSSISPTLSTSFNSARNSAKKVDSKFNLPKQQKTDAPMLNYIFDTHSAANKHHHHDQRYGPHFEDVQRVGQPTNMTVQAGSSIHLNCRISLLQDKTVSWVRRSAQNEENGLDLLTVGLHAYTGDKRYKMEFQYPNNWRLKIINVKKDDEATYECQISTHPPRVIQINLHVNAPKVMIVDEYGDPLQEKYYEIDSTLQLSCVVRNVAMSSSVVFWKHSENVLNYDVTRGGVSVKTELMEDGANSTLSIAKIHKADSGNYTCSISEYQNFTIVVHILNGESFAELHHGGARTVAHTTWQYVIGLYLILLLCRWNCR